MITDALIQLDPYMASPWRPDIAPCGHSAAGVKRIPGSHNLLCWVEGTTDPAKKLYPGTLFRPVTPRPVYVNSGHISLSVAFTVGIEGIQNGHVLETDLILVQDGWKYNLSGQRHVATGQIDIGNWTDTGLRAGPILADHFYVATWTYRYDAKAHTCSVVSYDDGKFKGMVPPALGNMPATPCDWKEFDAVPDKTEHGAAYLQVPQMGSLPAGGDWAVRIGDVSLRWW